jgi:hypothetical protein
VVVDVEEVHAARVDVRSKRRPFHSPGFSLRSRGDDRSASRTIAERRAGQAVRTSEDFARRSGYADDRDLHGVLDPTERHDPLDDVVDSPSPVVSTSTASGAATIGECSAARRSRSVALGGPRPPGISAGAGRARPRRP